MADVAFEKKERRMVIVRNFVFGVDDGLVSTVGFLSGIAAVGTPRETIVLTGVVLVFVEAFSMGIGSLLAEHSAEEYVLRAHGRAIERNSRLGAAIMFASYLTAGFVPLLPYFFLTPMRALAVSIAVSLLALLVLGVVSARAARVPVLREALRMFVIGGAAVGVGVLVGVFVR